MEKRGSSEKTPRISSVSTCKVHKATRDDVKSQSQENVVVTPSKPIRKPATKDIKVYISHGFHYVAHKGKLVRVHSDCVDLKTKLLRVALEDAIVPNSYFGSRTYFHKGFHYVASKDKESWIRVNSKYVDLNRKILQGDLPEAYYDLHSPILIKPCYKPGQHLKQVQVNKICDTNVRAALAANLEQERQARYQSTVAHIPGKGFGRGLTRASTPSSQFVGGRGGRGGRGLGATIARKVAHPMFMQRGCAA